VLSYASTVTPFTPGPQGPGPAARNPNIAPVTQLPKLPPAMDLKSSSGRSNVVIPPAVQPVQVAQGQPQPPPQPPPTPVAGQPVLGTDIAWATVMYHIPVAEIAKEFKD